MSGCMTACGDAAAKGPVEIEAAATARCVQCFSDYVKIWHGTHHEAFFVYLRKGHAAAGGLCLLPAEGGQTCELPVLKGAGESWEIGGGEAAGKPGGLPNRASDTLVNKAGHEFFRSSAGHQLDPLAEDVDKFLLRAGGEEVNVENGPPGTALGLEIIG